MPAAPAEFHFARLREYLLRGGDAVLHVVFSIDEAVQSPGLRHLRGFGEVASLPPPQWLGIHDDSGRLMVGINYVTYAMTH